MPFGQKLNILDTTTRKALVNVFSEPNFMKEVPAVYGAGAISTYMAPRQYRGVVNNHIINETPVDLTGLACYDSGDGDCIGLAAGGYAYIARHTLATHGIVYRVEMICLETPTEATATFEQDIDLRSMSAGTTEYGTAVTTAVLTAGLDWVIGKMVVTNVPAITTNDYVYLATGSTAGSTGVYGAGQFIIRMFGHKDFN